MTTAHGSGQHPEDFRAQAERAIPHEGYCALWMPRGKPCQCRQREATVVAVTDLLVQATAAATAAPAEHAATGGTWVRVCDSLDCTQPATLRGTVGDGEGNDVEAHYCAECAGIIGPDFEIADVVLPGAPCHVDRPTPTPKER